MALRWILMFPEVSATIPGARHIPQAEDNIRAADLPPLSDATMTAIRDVYDRLIRPQVESRW
jgi:aryl-alcohol dehydrogenase-like predicted oxidoreductase